MFIEAVPVGKSEHPGHYVVNSMPQDGFSLQLVDIQLPESRFNRFIVGMQCGVEAHSDYAKRYFERYGEPFFSGATLSFSDLDDRVAAYSSVSGDKAQYVGEARLGQVLTPRPGYIARGWSFRVDRGAEAYTVERLLDDNPDWRVTVPVVSVLTLSGIDQSSSKIGLEIL